MANSFLQGKYSPRNPIKYVGDLDNIIFRSSWELNAMKFFDGNPNVLRWASEPIAITYTKPTDGKRHRYFPDFWIEIKNREGKIVQELIEIKPKKDSQPSKSRSRKAQLYENITYAINMAKWTAASQWCQAHGMVFRVITECELFK
jgi:hypothetical protein